MRLCREMEFKLYETNESHLLNQQSATIHLTVFFYPNLQIDALIGCLQNWRHKLFSTQNNQWNPLGLTPPQGASMDILLLDRENDPRAPVSHPIPPTALSGASPCILELFRGSLCFLKGLVLITVLK